MHAPGAPTLIYARLVGGSSTHFTANFWRFHEVDFHERSLLGPIAGTTFDDWPIDYAKWSPTTRRSSGDRCVRPAGASPFDPPRSKPYPMPPLPVKSSGVLPERGARKLGLHLFPAPMAIASEPYRDRPACAHCGFCIGFGCEMGQVPTLYTGDPRGGHRAMRGAERKLRAPDRGERPRPGHRRRATSTRKVASSSRRRARWSSARTAPRRRDCC